MAKITEIRSSGPLPSQGGESSTRAQGDNGAGPSRPAPPVDDRLGGRPPQAESSAQGARPRASIIELQAALPANEARITIGGTGQGDRSNRSEGSWATISLHGSEIGASGRATIASETGASARLDEVAARTETASGGGFRATMASLLGSLGNTASAAAGAAGGAISAGVDQLKSLASSAATLTGQAAGAAAGELKQQGEALAMVLPSKRTLGAVAGHLVHQTAAVGVPTFVREMMAEAMMLSLRHMPPDHALALQVVSGTVSVGVQLMRRRQEARHPDEAARGFHALTAAQWNALPPERQAKLRSEQDLHSRMVTNIQVLASLTHIGIGAYAVRSQDKSLAETPAKLFVGDFKSMAYSMMRDSVQASFNMVGGKEPTTGLIGPHLTASAAAYVGITVAGNYGFTLLPPMVPNASLASAVLRGESSAMSHGAAWQTRAAVSAVKAAINTAVHTSDWSFMTQQEAKQAGTVQQWEPKLKFLKPETRDYSRLKDATPARITLIAGSNAMSNAVGLAMRNMPEAATTATLNLLGGAYEGLMYKPIGNTWQAQMEVRAKVRENATLQLGQTQPPLGRDEAQTSARMRGQA